MIETATKLAIEWKHFLQCQIGALIMTVSFAGMVTLLTVFALKINLSDIMSIQNAIIALVFNLVLGFFMHYAIIIKHI